YILSFFEKFDEEINKEKVLKQIEAILNELEQEKSNSVTKYQLMYYAIKSNIDIKDEKSQNSLYQVVNLAKSHDLDFFVVSLLLSTAYNTSMLGKNKEQTKGYYDIYELALEFFIKNDDVIGLILYYINIGDNRYYYFGEYETAINFVSKGVKLLENLDEKELYDFLGLLTAFVCLGKYYRHLGEYTKSHEKFTRALELADKYGDRFTSYSQIRHLGILYSMYIELLIDIEKFNQIPPFLDKFEKIANKEKNREMDMWLLLTKALVLKTSSRLRDWIKAIDYLEKVVNEKEIFVQITFPALLSLCELLLREIGLTGDLSILDELKKYINMISNLAEINNSFWWLAEASFLDSQVALLELDLDRAKNLLNQAQSIAEENGLQRLAMKISNEYDKMLEQIDKWEVYADQKVPIDDRLELLNLEESVANIARKKLISDSPKEVPVMVLILVDTGIPLYSKKYKININIDEALVSGLLSAISAFTMEAFSSEEGIERIKHKEYTIAIKPQSKLMFCYMFKGSSYHALKKLDRFVEEIKDGEIWTIINKKMISNVTLNNSDNAIIEKIIENTFPK
ncbi:MAG: hypothetical protein KAS95_07250, partial [Candidatus Heimdallarchaeota archaeon]|nr:hypothetical protein [Candidatus Heimdallarchaeota archaeon]